LSSGSGFGKEFTGRSVLYVYDPNTNTIYPVNASISSGQATIYVIPNGSSVILPVDVQARYKPTGSTVYSGTVNSSGNTSDINVSTFSSVRLMAKVTGMSGTSPSISFYVDGKYDATGDYVTLLSQANITSTGIYELGQLDNLTFNNIRVRWVVSGTSVSITFTVAMQALT